MINRGPPTYAIVTHSMGVQTFTTDRGPPVLAMSIASVSKVVRHSYANRLFNEVCHFLGVNGESLLLVWKNLTKLQVKPEVNDLTARIGALEEKFKELSEQIQGVIDFRCEANSNNFKKM